MKIDWSINTWDNTLKNSTFKSNEIFPVNISICSDSDVNLSTLSLDLNLFNSGKNILFSSYTNTEFEFQIVTPQTCNCITYIPVNDLKQKLIDKGLILLDIKHEIKYEVILTLNNLRKYLLEGQFYIV